MLFTSLAANRPPGTGLRGRFVFLLDDHHVIYMYKLALLSWVKFFYVIQVTLYNVTIM